MMHRALSKIGNVLALGLAVGAFSLVGCTGGESGNNTGLAGVSGAGTAGTGSNAGTAGTGSNAGTAGTGSNAGTAGTGSNAGTAGTGSNAGTAGTGAAGTGAAGTGAAGTSATGTAGTTGAAGSTAGGRPSGRSAGCDMAPPATEMSGKSVSHTITVTGMDPKYAAYVNRTYCTKMPTGYDPSKAYPVVFYGGGCGAFGCEGGGSFGSRTDIILVEANISRANTGLVPEGAAPGCFQMGRVTTPDSPEAFYFDQVMDQVEKMYCVDKGKVFVSGTSSGAWLSNTLACQRGNRVRGTAADSGGIGFDRGTCKPGTAVMIMPGDATNATQGGNAVGAAVARDLFIKLNGCSMTPTQMKFGNDTCDVYGGCDSPVAWCNVGGGHQSGNGHLGPTGMAFWNTLK
jgi:poly(3-hydroxybutyrate) depolymerase